MSTRAVHAGEEHNPTSALVTPILQTSTFRLPDAATGAELMATSAPSAFYTRWGNPTVRAAEAAIAALEGAEAGLLAASGMGAIHGALATILAPGDHVVASRSLYAATTEIFTGVFAQQGVETTFVAPADSSALAAALRPGHTRLVYVETLSNPTLDVCDLAAAAQLAHDAGALIAVDHTFASPMLCRPLELGCDLVLHSTTKYLNGHSDATGGVALGARDLIERIWKTTHLLGACAAPFEAWLLRRGLRTLTLRVPRQCENALELARWLEARPEVARVSYPGLPSHRGHLVALRQFSDTSGVCRAGGMIAFEMSGGLDAARHLVQSTELIQLAVSLGGVESIWEHPASMSHAPVGPEHRAAAGIADGLIRFSVGIEDVADLRGDLERAFARSAGV